MMKIEYNSCNFEHLRLVLSNYVVGTVDSEKNCIYMKLLDLIMKTYLSDDIEMLTVLKLLAFYV